MPAKRMTVATHGSSGQRYRTDPGEAYQMDWGFTEVEDWLGFRYRIACFAMVCHHCGTCYIEFFPNARQENLFIGMSETAGKEYQRWTLLFSALALLVSGLSIYFSVTTQEEMARVPYQTQVTVGVGCAVSTSAGTGKTVKYLTFDITNTGHAAFELSRIAIKEHGADTEKASFCPNQSYSSSSEFPNDTTAMDLKILEPGEHISYWYMLKGQVLFGGSIVRVFRADMLERRQSRHLPFAEDHI